MKFGLRTPSLKRRISARTSRKRYVRHNLGLKAPRGMGMLTNPRKALYNKVYNRTTFGVDDLFKSNKAKRNSQLTEDNSNGYGKGIAASNNGNIIRSSSKALTVTSKNFDKLRSQITEIYGKRVELHNQLRSEKIKSFFITVRFIFSFILIFGFFYKTIGEKRLTKKLLIEELEKQLSETYVKLTFADKSQFEKSWLNCVDTFSELTNSEKIWDLTYTENVDKVRARTIAENAIKRVLIKSDLREIEFIKSDLQNLFLANANGPDIFIYPTFLVLFKNNTELGIFDLKEISVEMKLTGYIEEDKVPSDTEIINHTWKKANKDGSMDRRFKGNYQIPIVKYGELSLTSDEGLDEAYMFSNPNSFSEFMNTYNSHVSRLKKV